MVLGSLSHVSAPGTSQDGVGPGQSIPGKINSVIGVVAGQLAEALSKNPSQGTDSRVNLKALTGFLIKSLEKNPDCLNKVKGISVTLHSQGKSLPAIMGTSDYVQLSPAKVSVRIRTETSEGQTKTLKFNLRSAKASRLGNSRAEAPNIKLPDASQSTGNDVIDLGQSGLKFSGKFSLQKGRMVPNSGRGSFVDGTEASGTWRFDRSTGQSYLMEGTVRYSSGAVAKGKFWSPRHLLRSSDQSIHALAAQALPVLKEGRISDAAGAPVLIVGQRGFDPESLPKQALPDFALASKLTSASPVVQCMSGKLQSKWMSESCRVSRGELALVSSENSVYLRKGLVTYPSGARAYGEFYTPAELRVSGLKLAEQFATRKIPILKNGTFVPAQQGGRSVRIGPNVSRGEVSIADSHLLEMGVPLRHSLHRNRDMG